MREVFITANPESYESRTCSAAPARRGDQHPAGKPALGSGAEIGARDGLSVVQLVEKLYDELARARARWAISPASSA